MAKKMLKLKIEKKEADNSEYKDCRNCALGVSEYYCQNRKRGRMLFIHNDGTPNFYPDDDEYGRSKPFNCISWVKK